MCEANAYIRDKDGTEKLFLAQVDTLTHGENCLVLENIFSERKTFNGKIRELALVDHKIVLETI